MSESEEELPLRTNSGMKEGEEPSTSQGRDRPGTWEMEGEEPSTSQGWDRPGTWGMEEGEEPSTSLGRGRQKQLLSDSEDEALSGAAGDDMEDSDDDSAAEKMEGGESGDSDSSSGVPGAETCAICLGRMRGEVGSPSACEHIFCLICILEWAKTNATCPQDRIPFTEILVRRKFGEAVQRSVSVKKEEKQEPVVIEEDNPTYCEVCNECNREERLLLCDGCDKGFHLECLDPPLTQVPVEEWFCPQCSTTTTEQEDTAGLELRQRRNTNTRSRSGPAPLQQPSQFQPRRIPRTRATERIRERIQTHRKIKKKLKNKARKQRKRDKIADGEIEDPRAAVKPPRPSFSLYVQEDNDIDAEYTVDELADQLLYGGSSQFSHRNQTHRKANAARLLKDLSMKPVTAYCGKSSVSVLQKIEAQPNTHQDDVLSGILQDQSIVLSSSKKLQLTEDRKFMKQGEKDIEEEDYSKLEKEEKIMFEPLPSQKHQAGEANSDAVLLENVRRKPGSSGNDCSRSDNYRRSPSFALRRHNLHDSRRSYTSNGHATHSPLDDRRRSPPRLSYQHWAEHHSRKAGYGNYKRSHSSNRPPERHRPENLHPWQKLEHGKGNCSNYSASRSSDTKYESHKSKFDRTPGNKEMSNGRHRHYVPSERRHSPSKSCRDSSPYREHRKFDRHSRNKNRNYVHGREGRLDEREKDGKSSHSLLRRNHSRSRSRSWDDRHHDKSYKRRKEKDWGSGERHKDSEGGSIEQRTETLEKPSCSNSKPCDRTEEYSKRKERHCTSADDSKGQMISAATTKSEGLSKPLCSSPKVEGEQNDIYNCIGKNEGWKPFKPFYHTSSPGHTSQDAVRESKANTGQQKHQAKKEEEYHKGRKEGWKSLKQVNDSFGQEHSTEETTNDDSKNNCDQQRHHVNKEGGNIGCISPSFDCRQNNTVQQERPECAKSPSKRTEGRGLGASSTSAMLTSDSTYSGSNHNVPQQEQVNISVEFIHGISSNEDDSTDERKLCKGSSSKERKLASLFGEAEENQFVEVEQQAKNTASKGRDVAKSNYDSLKECKQGRTNPKMEVNVDIPKFIVTKKSVSSSVNEAHLNVPKSEPGTGAAQFMSAAEKNRIISKFFGRPNPLFAKKQAEQHEEKNSLGDEELPTKGYEERSSHAKTNKNKSKRPDALENHGKTILKNNDCSDKVKEDAARGKVSGIQYDSRPKETVVQDSYATSKLSASSLSKNIDHQKRLSTKPEEKHPHQSSHVKATSSKHQDSAPTSKESCKGKDAHDSENSHHKGKSSKHQHYPLVLKEEVKGKQSHDDKKLDFRIKNLKEREQEALKEKHSHSAERSHLVEESQKDLIELSSNFDASSKGCHSGNLTVSHHDTITVKDEDISPIPAHQVKSKCSESLHTNTKGIKYKEPAGKPEKQVKLSPSHDLDLSHKSDNKMPKSLKTSDHPTESEDTLMAKCSEASKFTSFSSYKMKNPKVEEHQMNKEKHSVINDIFGDIFDIETSSDSDLDSRVKDKSTFEAVVRKGSLPTDEGFSSNKQIVNDNHEKKNKEVLRKIDGTGAGRKATNEAQALTCNDNQVTVSKATVRRIDEEATTSKPTTQSPDPHRNSKEHRKRKCETKRPEADLFGDISSLESKSEIHSKGKKYSDSNKKVKRSDQEHKIQASENSASVPTKSRCDKMQDTIRNECKNVEKDKTNKKNEVSDQNRSGDSKEQSMKPDSKSPLLLQSRTEECKTSSDVPTKTTLQSKGAENKKYNSNAARSKQQQKVVLEAKVVGEVKRWLDPHYRDKAVTKREYKEIVAKCVNKVVATECGEVVESEKMRVLVEGYVKLYKHKRRKLLPN